MTIADIPVYLTTSKKKGAKGPLVYYVIKWAGTDGAAKEKCLGRTKDSGGRLGKRDAQRLRREHQTALATGTVSRDRVAIPTLADWWERDKKDMAADGDLAESTQYEYRIAFNTHILKALNGNKRLSQIDETDVRALRTDLAEKGSSDATTSKVMRAFRASLNRAKEQRLISRVPFYKGAIPTTNNKAKDDVRIFEPDEIAAMIEVAPDDSWKMFLGIAFASGLRKNEILNLRWSDIDAEQKCIHVRARKASTFNHGDAIYPVLAWKPKTKESERSVPINDELIAALHRWKLKSDGSEYVFIDLPRLLELDRMTQAGKIKIEIKKSLLYHYEHVQHDAARHLARDTMSNDELLLKRAEALGWATGTVHDMRKTFCTHAAKHLPMHVLMRYAGHSNIQTTAQFYAQTTADDDDALRETMGSLVKVA